MWYVDCQTDEQQSDNKKKPCITILWRNPKSAEVVSLFNNIANRIRKKWSSLSFVTMYFTVTFWKGPLFNSCKLFMTMLIVNESRNWTEFAYKGCVKRNGEFSGTNFVFTTDDSIHSSEFFVSFVTIFDLGHDSFSNWIAGYAWVI